MMHHKFISRIQYDNMGLHNLLDAHTHTHPYKKFCYVIYQPNDLDMENHSYSCIPNSEFVYIDDSPNM